MSSVVSRTDPATVYMRLYDALPERFGGSAATHVRDERAVLAEAARVERIVLETGETDAETASVPTGPGRDDVLYARLVGLDRALWCVHPGWHLPVPWPLRGIAACYAKHGRFNEDASLGLLLPRLVDYDAPTHQWDKFEAFSVIRVLPGWIGNVEYRTVGPMVIPTREDTAELTVACVPFLDSVKDVEIERVEESGELRYRLRPHLGGSLQSRIDEVIAALDSSGATVGLLPEGALCAELLDIWQSRLRETFGRGPSAIAVIVAGSGPVGTDDPPRNTAVVLDRCGREVWRQDKMCDYTLTTQTREDWELGGLGTENLIEDITPGETLVVMETGVGRLAVLICEDLVRCEHRHAVPREFGVSHIFAPVFDAPLGKNCWERYAADRHLRGGGARVAVANSRVVGDLRQVGSRMVTALAVTPRTDVGAWTSTATEGWTGSPTECAVLRLSPVDHAITRSGTT